MGKFLSVEEIQSLKQSWVSVRSAWQQFQYVNDHVWFQGQGDLGPLKFALPQYMDENPALFYAETRAIQEALGLELS